MVMVNCYQFTKIRFMQKSNFIFRALKRFNLLHEAFIILKEIKRIANIKKSLKYYNLINETLKNNKIISLDIGASGGFNNEENFNKIFNKFFNVYEIEPIKKEYSKIKSKNKQNLGFWSENKILNLFVTKDFGATSVFEPNLNNFQFIYNNYKSLKNIRIERTEKINCISINNFCLSKNIPQIDYIKIDTQGSEYEILSGLGKYRPLIIRAEAQSIECYNKIKTFEQIMRLLDAFGYVAVNFEKLDNSVLKLPIFMDIIFLPKFENYKNSKIINQRKNKFLSLLQIFSLQKYLKLYNL